MRMGSFRRVPPLGRVGTAGEFANAVRFSASDPAGCGTSVDVDGDLRPVM